MPQVGSITNHEASTNFLFHRFKSFASHLSCLHLGEKKRRRPSRYCVFEQELVGEVFEQNKNNQNTPNPAKSHVFVTATQHHFMNTFVFFFFFVKNRGPKNLGVHIFRFGRKFDVLVTVSATEAFVGDPVQIQTEKSGSQRG